MGFPKLCPKYKYNRWQKFFILKTYKKYTAHLNAFLFYHTDLDNKIWLILNRQNMNQLSNKHMVNLQVQILL